MTADLSSLPAREISDDEGFLLASLAPVETGLPMTIWLCAYERETQTPYVRVCPRPGWPPPTREVTTLTAEDRPQIIHGELGALDRERLGARLALNRQLVADYWRHEVDAFALVRRLRALPDGPTPQPRVG